MTTHFRQGGLAVSAEPQQMPLIDASTQRVAVACERIEAMTNDVRQLGNRLFGLRPEVVPTSGTAALTGCAEQHNGSMQLLGDQIERLGEALDEINAQFHRLEAL